MGKYNKMKKMQKANLNRRNTVTDNRINKQNKNDSR